VATALSPPVGRCPALPGLPLKQAAAFGVVYNADGMTPRSESARRRSADAPYGSFLEGAEGQCGFAVLRIGVKMGKMEEETK
jgi:hypothetical protein